MILNVIFHGAWGFVIDETNNKILAITPDETDDHRYEVGSFNNNRWKALSEHDFEFSGVSGSLVPIIPSRHLSPVVSAEMEKVRGLDPTNSRFCCLSMPMPIEIVPLEPYVIGNFLKGTAALQLQALKQFPAVQCFIYNCNSLDDLLFQNASKEEIHPPTSPNPSPNQETANLHILATYSKLKPDAPPDSEQMKQYFDAEREQMERCFSDLALCFPGLNFGLKLPSGYENQVHSVHYTPPRGVTKDEVELNPKKWAKGSNCQNLQFFLTKTASMNLNSIIPK